MPKTASVVLGEQSAAFVRQQIAQGRYRSESEVVQAGLELLKERELKVNALRQALKDGEDSGIIEDFNIDDFLDEMKRSRVPSG